MATKTSKKSPNPTVAATVKAEKKGAKAAGPAVEAPALDADALEEQEEASDAAASAASSGNAAALAAAAGSSTESASFKNFRHHPDMENFYRFIYDNDLRHEALEIIDTMMTEKLSRKLVKAAKAHAH